MVSIQKIQNAVIAVFAIYIPMWISYFVENAIHFQIGIFPRSFVEEDIFGILGVWLSHANLEHIENNSISFLPVLIFMGLLEKNIFKTLFLLILSSGIAIWLLGSPNSFHIGASALIFASFGYIFMSVFKGRILYLIPIVLALFYYGINYFINIFHGFIPHDNISIAGHLGGFISGIITAFFTTDKKEIKI